jgi:sugar phosphate permease
MTQSFTLFLPSIISGMGYRATTAQLFTVPPNMAAFVTVLVTAYYSDKLKNRGYFIIGGSIVGICGYIMLLTAKTNAVRYAGTFLVAIGVFQGSPMIMVCVPRAKLEYSIDTTAGLDLEQHYTTLRSRGRCRRGNLNR